MHVAKKRVLVVDDEQVIADTLAKILDLNGYDASAVYTGTAAVESARTLRPDLIISDVIMPDMNGIEAAISIRGFLPAARSCYSPDKRRPPTCSKTRAPKGMNSRFSQSLSTHLICWQS